MKVVMPPRFQSNDLPSEVTEAIRKQWYSEDEINRRFSEYINSKHMVGDTQ